jgi:hypothetical protein
MSPPASSPADVKWYVLKRLGSSGFERYRLILQYEIRPAVTINAA